MAKTKSSFYETRENKSNLVVYMNRTDKLVGKQNCPAKKIYKFLDNHRRGKVGAKALFFFYQGIADRIFTEIRENFDIGS